MANASNLKGPRLHPTATKAFFEDQATSLRSPATRRCYNAVLRQLQQAHPNHLVGDFTEDELAAWLSRPGLSPNSVRAYHKAIARFFEWATWKDLLAKDPAVGLKRRLSLKPRNTKANNWLSEGQVGALLRAPGTDTLVGKRDTIVLAVGIFTGLRKSEIAGLRWGHVDLHEGTIAVRGKGDKPALVGIPEQLHELLTRQRWEAAAGLGRPVEPTDPVLPRLHYAFDSQPGDGVLTVRWAEPLGPGTIDKIVKTAGAAIGVPTLAPHDLRRTFAGLLESKAVPIQKISKALRHSNVGTTERYLEASPRKGVEAVADFRLAL